MGLDRFMEAQSVGYELAMRELSQGGKQSCWIWYIFPQQIPESEWKWVSATTRKYAIDDLPEAKAYLCHQELGPRYFSSVSLVYEMIFCKGKDPVELMGSDVDAKKLHSSVTLMRRASKELLHEGHSDVSALSKFLSEADRLLLYLPAF